MWKISSPDLVFPLLETAKVMARRVKAGILWVLAAGALGIAAGAFEHATAYAKERESFGKPIIRHQGISFKLADMAMKISAARQLLYKTCALLDHHVKKDSLLSVGSHDHARHPPDQSTDHEPRDDVHEYVL